MTRLLASISLLLIAADPAGSGEPVHRLRRPIDAVLVPGGGHLLVANRRSGSVSVIDTASRQVTSELAVGSRLSDLAVVPGTTSVLALDESAHQLIGLSRTGGEIEVSWRLPVARYPVCLAVSGDGRSAWIGSLWSRRLTAVSLAGDRPARVTGVLDLPFAPRHLLALPDGRRLVIAEAFGGRLGLVAIETNRLLAVRRFEAHNIGGLALAPDRRSLLVPHQILDPEHATTRGGVHWGGVLLNVVRSVSLATLDRPSADIQGRLGLDYVGVPDRAAGDPGPLAVAPGGRRVLLLAGVHEVCTSPSGVLYVDRLTVGLGPSAVAVDAEGRLAWITNRFSDTVSVVRINPLARLAEIPLGPTPGLTAADRGEQLFHDARLSSDGWFSCHSCHPRGHTNNLLNDNFGDDAYGAPRKVLSLLGSGDTGPWAWNGSVSRLTGQVHKSVTTTLRGTALTDRQASDLAEYLRRLPPPPSIATARGTLDAEAVGRGRVIFDRAGCATCHAPPSYTSARTFDVGLDDELGRRRFNPPSLRGISQRHGYFHDNRARDLRELLVRFRHGLETPLPRPEVDDLVRFLESL